MDGYLSKPIQSAALDAELRRVRGLAPANGPPRAAHGPRRLAPLLEDVRDPALVSEIVDDFAGEARAASGALRDAFANGDPRAVKRIAHTLASTAGLVGANELADLAREVERLVAAGDREALLARIAALEGAVSDAVRAVSAERDDLCARRSEPE
jgi:HPt (histidine-containing phosphotransfer) domain-containing protein